MPGSTPLRNMAGNARNRAHVPGPRARSTLQPPRCRGGRALRWPIRSTKPQVDRLRSATRLAVSSTSSSRRRSTHRQEIRDGRFSTGHGPHRTGHGRCRHASPSGRCAGHLLRPRNREVWAAGYSACRSCCRRRVTSMRRSAAMARGGSLTTFGGRPESCGSDSRWRRRSWGRRQPAARFGDSWSSEICGHTPRGRHASIAACKWIEARHL
jgi:hypothetical protein